MSDKIGICAKKLAATTNITMLESHIGVLSHLHDAVSKLRDTSQKCLCQKEKAQLLEGIIYGLNAVLELVDGMKTVVMQEMEKITKNV